MKETRKARVIYNEVEDCYEIEINTGDGWGFSCSFKCVAREKNGETNFVHYAILKKFYELQRFGYEIDFTRL